MASKRFYINAFWLLLILLCAAAGEAQNRWNLKTTGVGSGFGLAVALNPQNSNTVYASGSAFGTSYDKGETWKFSSVPGGLVDTRIIVVHPVDTTIIFLGGNPTGLFKSSDNGKNWKGVLATVGFNGVSVVVDPLHPDTLYCGSVRTGDFYSSYDRGETWSLTADSLGSFCSLAIRPDHPNVLVGAMSGELLKSVDYGKTWRLVYQPQSSEVPRVLFDPINPDNVYASIFGVPGDAGVVKSTDGGDTWQAAGLFNREIWALALNPAQPQIIYGADYRGAAYRTVDGGATWCTIKRGLSPNGDGWMLAVSPQSEVYLAESAAVFKLAPDSLRVVEPPENFSSQETGTGTSMLLRWQPVEVCDQVIARYMVLYGTASDAYTDSIDAGLNTSIIISNLQDGVFHYATVVAINPNGRRSEPAPEIRFKPMSAPHAPRNLAARHGLRAAKLSWAANTDPDLLGYNVYRSTQSAAGFEKINAAPVAETFYVDTGLTAGRFFYSLKALDNTQIESEASNVIALRPITLEQGLLLLDATRDGNGSVSSPSDEQVDGFYRRLLANFAFSEYDVRTAGFPGDTLGIYSAIIWHSDDFLGNNVSNASTFLADYLEAGGKLVLSGWKILNSFTGGQSPKIFNANDFAAKYLHLDTVWTTTELQFTGAKGVLPRYADIEVDPARVPNTAWNGRFREVHVIAPRAGAEVMFNFGAADPSFAFSNRPVGVKYISDQYKIAVLGFPLYFMKEEQSQAALTTILTKDFGLTTSVAEPSPGLKLPDHFVLLPNYPNPFRETTKMHFALSQSARVQIEIFNLLGERLATVVNENFAVGQHAVPLQQSLGSNGVYFYRMKVLQNGMTVFQQTRKLVLVR